MIRAVFAASLMMAAMTIVPAVGQQSDTGRGFFDVIKPDDLRYYCIYKGEAYSIGAFMCDNIKQSNVCSGPEETAPSGVKPMGRAFWRSQNAEKVCG
jgi:hypothetical protein